MQLRLDAKHIFVGISQRGRAVFHDGAVAPRLEQAAVEGVLENIVGIDQHAASEVVLVKTKCGGVVQSSGIDVHDKSWKRHDVPKAAENCEPVAF